MINHREWLATRRKLLESVKAEVRLRLGEPRPELGHYARAIEADYRGPWRTSRMAQLAAACAEARVVLGADFHAYAQSQRAFVRILRDQLEGVPLTLALECVRAEHDDAIALFLKKRMSEKRFLETVNWTEDWGFPWAHYRPFFDLARERGYRVVGLNTRGEGSLRARDAWTARRLRELARDQLVFAVIGEWHVARAHVPRLLNLGPGEVVTILQDVEPLYLKRARRAPAAHLEVLRAPHDVFCHFVSPPWMKWQSYLMFLEHTYDRELDHDAEVDHTDHVAGLVKVLASDLKVKISTAKLQVFCPDSRASLARLKMSLSPRLTGVLRYHLERDLSFLLPEKDWLYLSRATTNFAAGLAGQYVHAQLCGRTRAAWTFPNDFTALIWIEAVGFFFSKWINPRRRADTLESVRVRLAAADPRDHGRHVLSLALDQKLSEVIFAESARVRPRRVKRPRSATFIEAARVLGSLLGERLFENVRAGSISLPRLMTYLKMNPEAPEFGAFYARVTAELSRERTP